MSFAEGLSAVNLDLADPTVVLYACVSVIVVCLLLDAPAIAGAVRLLRIARRRAIRSSKSFTVRVGILASVLPMLRCGPAKWFTAL